MTAMTAIRLQRTIPAPPERVYRAWLDPELMVRWMSPGDNRATRAEVDEHVGGHHRVWQTASGGNGYEVGGFENEFLELVPDERIVLKWRFVGPEREVDPALDSRLTITLRPAPGDATELTLVHERLDGLAAAMPEVAANVETGWQLVLDQLAEAA
jgi:uncharacterized protein YndB with AHSA1/START domain